MKYFELQASKGSGFFLSRNLTSVAGEYFCKLSAKLEDGRCYLGGGAFLKKPENVSKINCISNNVKNYISLRRTD